MGAYPTITQLVASGLIWQAFPCLFIGYLLNAMIVNLIRKKLNIQKTKSEQPKPMMNHSYPNRVLTRFFLCLFLGIPLMCYC